MNFKSAEEWYQYIKEQYTKNEEVEVNSLLEQVPAKFIGDKIFNRIKEHVNEHAAMQQSYLEQMILINKGSFENKYKEPNSIIINYGRNSVMPTVIDNAWDLKGKQSVKNSIFKHHKKTDWEAIDYFQNAWFEEAIDFFNGCKSMTEQNIANSIDIKRLRKNEINNIDTFLDTGKYLSNSFYKGVVTEELYQYYNDKLWGGFAWDFVSTDVMFEKWDEVNTLKATEDNKTKSDILNEVMQDSLEKGWWLSIRLQMLLWMKEYLEGLEEQEVNDICSKYGRKPIFGIPHNIKRGFQLSSSMKISDLYKALIDKQLIESIELDCFKQAFLNGEGTIIWRKAANQLGYLIQQLKVKGATLNNDNWKTAENIFLINEKSVNGNSLKSGAEQITVNSQKSIDKIVDSLLSIH